LETACDYLLPPTHAYFLPFKQLIKQQMLQFQNSILELLHHHIFFSMFFKKYLKSIMLEFYHV
jgi:hypothetical protein